MTDLEEVADLEAQVEETVVEEAPVVNKPAPSSVAKILQQRNEARKENEALKNQLHNTEKMEKRLADMEEMVAKSSLEADAKIEKTEFYARTPIAKSLEADIDALRAEKDLSFDDAFKLVAAEKNPSLLLDEQYRNKATANTTLTGVAKENKTTDEVNTENVLEMSDDDFLKWSDAQARKERVSTGRLR